MRRWKAFRMLGIALLLGIYMVSIFHPVVAQARPGPGGGGPGMEEEEEEEEEVVDKSYDHPTYKGIAYGLKWNYSLTFYWGSQGFWVYGDGSKILFRQQVESGGTNIIQLRIWTQYWKDELSICMEPEVLDLFERTGVSQILVENGHWDEDIKTYVLYQVEDVKALMSAAGVDPDTVLHIWVGETEGPRIVLKTWEEIQLTPEDEPGQAI